jgi:cytochrome c5
MQQKVAHSSPIQSPKQLIVVVVLAFIVPIGLGLLLSQLVTSGTKGEHEDDKAILARIRPVGQVQIAAPAAAKGQLTGEQVYGQVCKTCHESGVLNAPKFGDKASWVKVVAQGQPTTVDHALKGIRSMPPKGGSADLADVEVERAVVFMANKGGANWKEPAAPAPAVAAAPAAPAVAAAAPAPAHGATATATQVATPALTAAAPANAAKADGKKVFDSTCNVCHGAGIAGAPKFGDKTAWAPRLATGIDTLYKVALTGKGAMPPKGGNKDLSDADVKAAVDYMAAAAK